MMMNTTVDLHVYTYILCLNKSDVMWYFFYAI